MDDKPDMNDLKCEVNNFLFSRLPDETTLKELEELAIDMWERIRQVWKAKEDAENKAPIARKVEHGD